MKNVNVDIGRWVPHSNDDTPDMIIEHSTTGLDLRHSQQEINLGSGVYAALLLPCIIMQTKEQ